MNKISLKKINMKTLFFFIALLGLSLFVYADVLFGNKVFLSSSYSMDMYEQFYPSLVTAARQVSKGEFFNHIDFSNGLGYKNMIFPYMIIYLPAFFGVQNVANLLAVFQAFKLVFAGLFFYLYIKKISNDEYAAMIGGLGYAFCGPMVLRQFWAFYSVEIFLVALWLYSVELYLEKKKFLLPFSTIAFFLNCNAYYDVLYVGIFSFYLVLRILSSDKKIEKKDIIVIISCIVFSAIISIGVLGLLETFSNSFHKMDNMSVPVQNNKAANSVFTDSETFVVAFFQTIGLNLVSKDIVEMSFLESPTFYCGLISIISLPLLFVYFKGKKKIIYLVILLLTILYFEILPIRIIANAKSGVHFKLSSFWIVLVFLYISAQTLSHFFHEPGKKAVIIMEIELLVIFFICLICAFVFRTDVNMNTMIAFFAFLFFYGLLVYLYYKSINDRHIIKEMILLVVIFEVAFFSKTFINDNVNLIEKNKFEESGYNENNLICALKYIDSRNELKDYRVDKQFFAFRLCDSMALDYYGSYYYIGAMGDNSDVADFYSTMNLPTESGNGSQYLYKKAYGTSLNTEINEILGFRYIISKDPYIANFGYGPEYKKQFGNIFLFENKYSLPMVFGYNKVISDKEFDKLTNYEKQKALMACCVVDEKEIGNFDKKMILKSDDLKIDMDQFEKYKNSSFEEEESVYSTQEVFRESTVLIKVEFDMDEPEYRAKLNHNFINGFSGEYFVRLDKGDNTYYFELNSQYITDIWFTGYDGEIITPEKCEFYVIPWKEYYKDYIENYNKLNDNISKIDEFSGSCVSGKIDMNNEGILYFSAPYDEWTLYIDGEEAKIIKSNIGFMGAKISKGYHTYRFVYNSGMRAAFDIIIRIGALFVSFIWGIIGGILYIKKKKTAIDFDKKEM